MTKIVFIAACLCLTLLTSSTKKEESLLTSSQLKKDFAIFRGALEESHPGLYRFRDKNEMDGLFRKAELSLNSSLTVLEFFKQISPIIAAVGCGHTSTALPVTWYENHPVGANRLPFDIAFRNERAFVIKNWSGDHDLDGATEITSVDGVPMAEIFRTLIRYIPGDGFITTSRSQRMEIFFSRILQVYIKESKSYSFGLKTKSGKTIVKTVALVSTSQINPQPQKPGLEFKLIKEKSTGILTIRSFDSDVSSADNRKYEEFVPSAFKTLKQEKISTLVIDLRANGGGRDDFGALLFAFLTDKPFKYYSYLEMKKPTLSFLAYTNRDAAFRDRIASSVVQSPDGRYLKPLSAHPSLPIQQPQPDHFDGKVFVLIDGLSFSATAEFASAARAHNRVTFVGRESGGAYEGNTSGGGVELTLPESKIRVTIPLTMYMCAVELDPKLKGRGIIPDVEVVPSIEDLVAEKDVVLERVGF